MDLLFNTLDETRHSIASLNTINRGSRNTFISSDISWHFSLATAWSNSFQFITSARPRV